MGEDMPDRALTAALADAAAIRSTIERKATVRARRLRHLQRRMAPTVNTGEAEAELAAG